MRRSKYADIYRRDKTAISDRNCSDFSSPAAAQRFFIAAGGPWRDPHGLDRDGDGSACEWGTKVGATIAKYRPAPVITRSRSTSSSRCYVGPRGGTYTITASGRKNYNGC
ncbi:MAG: excalibur calcium-binding domain-containing protein [Pseudomonadota bacterium]